jgi:PHD/YefM family antitoxin component YafN of YafNO toxin-antitoxin module
MPIILPLSELKSRPNEMIELCRKHDQPIFLTEKGHGSFVLMSQTVFDRMQLIMDLRNKLDEAKQSAAFGDKGITRAELRRRSQGRLRRARRK